MEEVGEGEGSHADDGPDGIDKHEDNELIKTDVHEEVQYL